MILSFHFAMLIADQQFGSDSSLAGRHGVLE